jgi:hypothetical protein
MQAASATDEGTLEQCRYFGRTAAGTDHRHPIEWCCEARRIDVAMDCHALVCETCINVGAERCRAWGNLNALSGAAKASPHGGKPWTSCYTWVCRRCASCIVTNSAPSSDDDELCSRCAGGAR